MSIADEIQKLEELHRNGSLSAEEFAQAKTAVLSGNKNDGTPPEASQERLAYLEKQNRIAQLDRNWEIERQNYMISGRYGYRYVPTKAMSVFSGIIIVGFGTLWTIFAASITGSFGAAGGPGGIAALFPLFGVLFIFVGLGISIYSYSKAGRYEQAYQHYQDQRRDLINSENDLASIKRR